MREQRYERVPGNYSDPSAAPLEDGRRPSQSSSPPPSFRSRASSLASRHRSPTSLGSNNVNRTLADTFDDGVRSDEDEEPSSDDRQRFMRSSGATTSERILDRGAPTMERRITQPSQFGSTAVCSAVVDQAGQNTPILISYTSSNDGVFANLNAKPERGEKVEEHPPTYEQAAADATPPYWETTILAPGIVSDEVYVDGLPVGSLFSFAWNGIISMSFTLVGFLLTYLLHTTHAAKNGSRAGLGVTLIQYGFYMKSSPLTSKSGRPESRYEQPNDPNSHNFDPATMAYTTAAALAGAEVNSHASNHGQSFPARDWFAYILMIVGWFVLIRAVTDFIKARRHEQLVLRSPDRGLNRPIVAEGEGAETAV